MKSMNLKYRAAVNCTLYFDIDADDEDHAQSIAEQVLEEVSGRSLVELSRALINGSVEIEDSYPDISEN